MSENPMPEPVTIDAAPRDGERTALLIAYVMYAGPLVALPMLPVVGVIINHLKVDATPDPVYRSHHRWLLRTFWWALGCSALLGIAAATVLLIPLALLGAGVLAVWYIYRVVRGALNFADRKPMPVD